MSEGLNKLVETWHAEREAYLIVAARLQSSVEVMSDLNVRIYRMCQAEGIDINNLKLNGDVTNVKAIGESPKQRKRRNNKGDTSGVSGTDRAVS